MMRNGRKLLYRGILLVTLFGVWTVLVQTVDVQRAGETGTEIGFAALNSWFHRLTGVHMGIYTVTDWLGLVPVLVCLVFGGGGLVQLVKRKSLLKVDFDLIFLGVYYMLVVSAYIAFEMMPVNYRPVYIGGRLEASYPSSTALLVLSVMPTLVFQAGRRVRRAEVKKGVGIFAALFSAGTVVGRLVSGVHWFTDIAGAVLLSAGLFCLYKGAVLLHGREER